MAYEDADEVLRAWRSVAFPGHFGGSLIVALLLAPAARRALQPLHASDTKKTPTNEQKKREEACWKLAAHSILSCAGAAACWASRDLPLFEGWPLRGHANSQRDETTQMRALYVLEQGFYVYSLYDATALEVARRDFLSTVGHHVLANALIAGSFWFAFLRVGALMMFLNDFVDVWFEAAKLLRYAAHGRASNVVFFVFLAAWGVCRQVVTPWLICAPAYADGWELVREFGATRRDATVWACFNAGLLGMVALHTYWFVFLVQKARNIVKS